MSSCLQIQLIASFDKDVEQTHIYIATKTLFWKLFGIIFQKPGMKLFLKEEPENIVPFELIFSD